MADVIHPLALDQLAKWEKYAREWNLYPEYREGQLHLVCNGFRDHNSDAGSLGACGFSIYQIYDGGNFRMFHINTVLALIVAHIRNHHREIEGMVYSG